jgi:hypothetical protein
VRAAGSVLEGAEIEVRLVDAIPQDRSGKRRAFVSLLGSEGHA